MAKIYAETQAQLAQILKKYTDAKAIGKGGFASVYELPGNKLLRMSVMEGATPTYLKKFVNTLKSHYDKLEVSGVTPHVEFIDVIQYAAKESPQGKQAIVITLMDKIKQTHAYPQWGSTAYNGDMVKILEALFSSAAQLEDAGFAHPDISPGNVLITDKGPMFIDLDYLCELDMPRPELAKQGQISFCDVSIGTPGFRLAKSKKVDEMIYKRHNMHYGLVALASLVTTDTKVSETVAEIVRRVGSKNADDRFESSAALLAFLRASPLGKNKTEPLKPLHANQAKKIAKEKPAVKKVVHTHVTATIPTVFYSAKTSLKKPRKATGAFKPCKPGFVRNPATNRCRKIVK